MLSAFAEYLCCCMHVILICLKNMSSRPERIKIQTVFRVNFPYNIKLISLNLFF